MALTQVQGGMILASGQSIPKAALPAGSVLQVVNVQSGTSASTASNIPLDDTIPQITEGAELFNLSITPTSATSKLFIQIFINFNPQSGGWITVALFQDSISNALASSVPFMPTATGGLAVPLNYFMTAGTTSSTTFRVRYGANSGSAIVNANNATLVGSSMTIMEIAA